MTQGQNSYWVINCQLSVILKNEFNKQNHPATFLKMQNLLLRSRGECFKWNRASNLPDLTLFAYGILIWSCYHPHMHFMKIVSIFHLFNLWVTLKNRAIRCFIEVYFDDHSSVATKCSKITYLGASLTLEAFDNQDSCPYTLPKDRHRPLDSSCLNNMVSWKRKSSSCLS